MTVHRASRTIPTREPTSVGSPDKKEGFAMRYQRLSSWFLGICIAVYVSMLASPATASVPGEIVKICPDAAIAAGPNNIVGVLWGYMDLFGPIIAIGALALLGLVAAIKKLRDKIMGWVIWPLGILIAFGTVATIITKLPGTSC